MRPHCQGRARRIEIVIAFVMTTSLLAPTSLHADASLPIFDAHVHYSEDAWSHYDVAAILTLLTKANVTRALVSSTPDDGTLRLFKADAERIVPILRPYRSRADMTSWYRDPAVLTYVEQRLARGHYRGIGEFHPFDAHDAETSQVRRLTELAVQHGILLHIHSDAAPIRVLYAINPELQILWAHAGMDTSPALIGEMLDRYPTLSTELSLRASDIAPSGRLAPVWRELLLRHPDRFMVGTDTWVPWRWREYAELVQEHRQWLTQLPHEAARQIGYENAVKRFAGTFHRRPPQ